MRSSTLIIQNNKILLMHRFKQGMEYFAIPGGSVEAGESAEEAARREAKEETGLDVVLGEMLIDAVTAYDGKEHKCFLVKSFSGEVELGGPEKERNNPQNEYKLEWHNLGEVKDLSLLPPEVKEKLVELILSLQV